MIVLKVNNNLDWNVEISDPSIVREGWWKLSELYKEWYGKAILRIDKNIISNEELFLEFIYYITGIYFRKIEEGLYQEK